MIVTLRFRSVSVASIMYIMQYVHLTYAARCCARFTVSGMLTGMSAWWCVLLLVLVATTVQAQVVKKTANHNASLNASAKTTPAKKTTPTSAMKPEGKTDSFSRSNRSTPMLGSAAAIDAASKSKERSQQSRREGEELPAQAQKKSVQQTQMAAQPGSSHKIWLSVDVVEQTPAPQGPDGSREKYRADAELNIVDSASGKHVYARSGDMIQLQPRRTYFIILSTVPQSNGAALRVQGPRTQSLRTGVATDGDVMYERKFLLLPPTQSPQTAAATKATRNNESARNDGAWKEPQDRTSREPDAPAGPIVNRLPGTVQSQQTGQYYDPSSRNSMPMTNAQARLFAAPYYVVQYCSLAEERDALAIRAALVQSGVRDARVELFDDALGRRFYRVRSGSYSTVEQARAAASSPIWNGKQWQLLKIKPIAVPAAL